jgi:hypothetical protein
MQCTVLILTEYFDGRSSCRIEGGAITLSDDMFKLRFARSHDEAFRVHSDVLIDNADSLRVNVFENKAIAIITHAQAETPRQWEELNRTWDSEA